MRITYDHIPAVLGHVKKLSAWLNDFCGQANATPVSLDDITEGIRVLYGTQIEVRLVKFESEEIRGFIEIYDAKAIIYLDSEMNLANTRYVFVKEACHIMLLTDENATRDPGSLIQYYVHQRADADARNHPDEVVCEEVTKHGALEILFPPALRPAAKERITAGHATLFTVGDGLQIPENLVEYALLDYYMDMMEKLRGEHPDRETFAAAAK